MSLSEVWWVAVDYSESLTPLELLASADLHRWHKLQAACVLLCPPGVGGPQAGGAEPTPHGPDSGRAGSRFELTNPNVRLTN